MMQASRWHMGVTVRLFQAVAGRRRHVPYRDHKLTSLLRDAVGGTAKVLMLLGPVGICWTWWELVPKSGGSGPDFAQYRW